MAVVCPTITAVNPHEYREQMERLEEFVERVHLDFMDGMFAPTKSPAIEQAWWPMGVTADLHVMFQRPLEHLETIISLNPNLVVIHAEADGVADFLRELADLGIQRGLAILQDTPVQTLDTFLDEIDHVLIFSGKLGYHGGEADLGLLNKVTDLRELRNDIEIGWDGGINAKNLRQLVDGGVDVLNVGGYIMHAEDPKANYDKLAALLG